MVILFSRCHVSWRQEDPASPQAARLRILHTLHLSWDRCDCGIHFLQDNTGRNKCSIPGLVRRDPAFRSRNRSLLLRWKLRYPWQDTDDSRIHLLPDNICRNKCSMPDPKPGGPAFRLRNRAHSSRCRMSRLTRLKPLTPFPWKMTWAPVLCRKGRR